jgi:hypothetical protein
MMVGGEREAAEKGRSLDYGAWKEAIILFN